ncbi:Transcriptional regulatory protein QseB [bioreactor metagenome]|uniref:Transcriptional regulatory protein QseB n=1 Tax=bioreactor metagenome TaxID=1076179 RepID=A0A645B0R9_9ZZZZ
MDMTLLVIDNDYDLVDQIRRNVASTELGVIDAFQYQAGARVVGSQKLSAVILNLKLPGSISGFDFLKDLRAAQPMPILAIGQLTEAERVQAYRLGADLIINEPVALPELIAATHALLRRYFHLNHMARFQTGGMALHYKELTLSQGRREVIMRGRPVELTAKEFDILYLLASNPGIVFSKETIYERVWREDYPFGSQCITDYMSAIRQKLGLTSSDSSYIETIYGVGYRLAPIVSKFDEYCD